MLLDSEAAWTLNNEAHIGVVLDEHGQSLLVRIGARAQQHLINLFFTMISLFTNHGLFFVYTVFLIIGVVILTYFFYSLLYL